jgi:hypothetical protein
MKHRFFFLLLTLWCTTPAFQANTAFLATNYYVTQTGNDNNAGTSMATPFRTITKALSKVQPGGIVFVQGGNTPYYERLNWSTSGTSSGIITLTSYDTNPVYISGASGGSNPNQAALLLIANKSNIRLSNFRFNTNYRTDAAGIQITGAGTNFQIDNCQVYNVGWNSSMTAVPTNQSLHNAHAIWVYGATASSLNAISITNCTVYNCNTGFSEGVTITGNVDNFFLNNDIVHDITNIGIDIAGHWSNPGVPANVNFARNGTVRACTVYNCKSPVKTAAGIYADGPSNIIIETSRSYRNGVGYSIGCEVANNNAQSILLRDNIATDNVECGLFLGSNTAGSTVLNCKITNNTFAQDYSKGGSGAEISLFNNSGSLLRQNIFMPRTPQCYAVGMWNNPSFSNFTSSYNLYWRLNNDLSPMTTPNLSVGSNPVYGDPKFISTQLPSPNYHIQSGSKAINRGDPVFTAATNEFDIDAQARIQVGRVDIGADESAYAAEGPELVEDRFETAIQDYIILFPNPAVERITVQFSKPYTGTIRLYNASGTLFENLALTNAAQHTFLLEQLPKGLYVVYTDQKCLQFVKS